MGRAEVTMIGRAVILVLLLLPATALAAGIGSKAPLPQQLAPQQPLFAVPAPPRLTAPQTATINNLGATYARTGNAATLQSGWSAFITGLKPKGADIETLVQLVMAAARAEANADLKAQTAEIDAINKKKAALRDELQRLGGYRSGLASASARLAPFTPSGVLPNVPPVANVAGADDYRRSLEAEIAKWEKKGDLANADLQNILQKQQQTLQMMSNISKMLYDTAQAVVRKIGG
jgi:hypothetical protein